ncbi:MAG: HAD family phosphatase [Actinomycetota bacterium]
MTSLLPAAVLWDMDGTLVDTEPYWLAAEAELVASFGGTWTHEDGMTLVGSGLWHAAGILQHRGVDLTEDDIVNRLTDRVMEQIASGVSWRPGALELLAELRDAGIPTALVTMSIRRMADHVASFIPFAAFDHIVSGDSVTHSKPHPEPYLRSAELLGVDAAECVAIEDSTTGLASAVAAGAVAIGVPLHSPLEHGRGYTIWPSLAGRRLADVSELFRSPRTDAA